MDFKSLPDKMAKMSPEEREKLAAKLDEELDSYISSLEASASQSKYQVSNSMKSLAIIA
jgi:hypothetical protein